MRGYRFDRFELRPDERVLHADGNPVKLGARAFDTLLALAERSHRVVGKRELMDLVWPELVVEENNLQAQVVTLRKLLGAGAIATVPGRGYKLTLAVETVDARPGAGVARDAQTADATPTPTSVVARHNLPRNVDPLIGREGELKQLLALIPEHRLVTVTGPGGVGKSRMAIDAGWSCIDRFTHGVWLVELASLSDPALVASAITTALGMAVAPSAEPLSALTRELGDRSLLLILDNCEHVVDAVAHVVEALLRVAPNVHTLISSQELVGIGGEHVLRLPSLSVPAETDPASEAALAAGAVQLFVARATAADPRFAWNDRNARAVAAICRRLDGIPLALEMAAARTSLLGVDGLAARLDERFRILAAGKRTALPRHRTLQATLDWSYGLLSPAEQGVFRRLGVFSGPFSLASAAAVVTDGEHDESAVIESLAGLCDKSLVATDPREGEVRYRLLETTRAYALERLAEANETQEAARRHALCYRRIFEACFDDWTLMSDSAFRARYATEIDNLRAAIAWSFGPDGDGETSIALIGSSGQLWLSLSLYREGEALLHRALECVTPSTPPALEAELWSALASIHVSRDFHVVIKAARRAADLYRSLPDSLRLGCALVLHALGSAYGSDDEAEPLLREARPLLEACGRPRLLAMLHSGIALFHSIRGRPGQAIPEFQAALKFWGAAGAEAGALRTLGQLADLVWQSRQLDDAIELARDVIERHQQSPFANRLSLMFSKANLFGMLVERGDLDEALVLGRSLLPDMCEMETQMGWSDHYASYLSRVGDRADAVRFVGWGDARRLASGLMRHPNEQRARDTALAIAQDGDVSCDIQRLLAEGVALSDADVRRLLSLA